MSTVTTKNVKFWPGDKWSCGGLKFEADTPLGLLIYEEVIPGPRHGEDSKELTVTLNGVDLSDWFDNLHPCPEFEAPGKPGRWADEFEAGVVEEVQETVEVWFDHFEGSLTTYLASKVAKASSET